MVKFVSLKMLSFKAVLKKICAIQEFIWSNDGKNLGSFATMPLTILVFLLFQVRLVALLEQHLAVQV